MVPIQTIYAAFDPGMHRVYRAALLLADYREVCLEHLSAALQVVQPRPPHPADASTDPPAADRAGPARNHPLVRELLNRAYELACEAAGGGAPRIDPDLIARVLTNAPSSPASSVRVATGEHRVRPADGDAVVRVPSAAELERSFRTAPAFTDVVLAVWSAAQRASDDAERARLLARLDRLRSHIERRA